MSESRMPATAESSVATREEERTVRPAVDIFEVSDGLGVVVDMPGVKKEDVDIRVENDILTITGKAHSELPGDSLYTEYGLGSYFRQFQLSEHVDQENIRAEMKHGVLTLRLPKAEKAKPRKISVNVK
ncbi:MAG: Hsp20/alpha crystallin family protein [Clostridiaceae bacterium]